MHVTHLVLSSDGGVRGAAGSDQRRVIVTCGVLTVDGIDDVTRFIVVNEHRKVERVIAHTEIRAPLR